MVKVRTMKQLLKHIAMANKLWGESRVNALDPNSCLIHYASIGNVAKAKAALRAGADVNTKDVWGYTPLQLCVQSAPGAKMGRMMKLLLKVGADESGVELVNTPTLIIPTLIMESVFIWRKKSSFYLVSKAFMGVKPPKLKRSRYDPPSCFPPDPSLGHFLEVNSDILNMVFKFLV